jgi:DNA polymerase I-like protein with 3'-5' exonuclease and polymerase domains
MSFAIGKKAWVIYIPRYEDSIPELKGKVFDLLNREDLLTIIQNVKYEELATRYWVFKQNNTKYLNEADFVKTNPRGNIIRNTFDTMLATHVIDERGGCTSLDFQNLVRFGLPKYNKKVKKYLEIKNKNDKKNTIHLCNPDDLIQYSGLDSITSFANYELLDNWLDKTDKFRWCYDFILKGHEVFANMSWNGLPVDEYELDTLEELLDSEVRKTYDQIENLPDVISYLEKNKNKVFTKSKKDDIVEEDEPINIITTIKRKLTMRKKDV